MLLEGKWNLILISYFLDVFILNMQKRTTIGKLHALNGRSQAIHKLEAYHHTHQPSISPPLIHPNLCHTPAPNAHPTLSVYNQSCRAKQSESTGKTAGAGARPPFSAVGGPAQAPKAQITSHIMRGLAQQALPLFLSLSLTHTYRQTCCSIIAEVLFCSVLLSSYYTDICQHSCFTCHRMAEGTEGN